MAGRTPPKLADSSLDAPCVRVVRRTGVDCVAKTQRIHPQTIGDLIDRLLQSKNTLHLTGRPKRRARAGIGEDIKLFGAHVWTRIHHRVSEADARPRGHAATPVTLARAGNRGNLELANRKNREPWNP